MKSKIFMLLTLVIPASVSAQMISLKDFCKASKMPAACSGAVMTSACTSAFLGMSDQDYQKATFLVESETFDNHVLKNFQYTFAGEDNLANGVTVELAAPKVKFNAAVKLDEEASWILKYDLSGGLNEDNKTMSIFTSDKFNTDFGVKVGAARVLGSNKSKYRIDGGLKKILHLQMIQHTNYLYSRADTLVELKRWQKQLTMSTPILGSDLIYDFFTTTLTTAPETTFTAFWASHPSQESRLLCFNVLAYDAFFKKFADIDNEDADQFSIDASGTFSPIDYEFIENKIAILQDSMAKPFWTRDILNWIQFDMGFKNSLLNIYDDKLNDVKSTGNPFYDINGIISFNRLWTDYENKSRFFFWKAGIGIGHGTNARFLTTEKVDKDVYYTEKPKELDYFLTTFELYGNPWKKAGLPGYSFSVRGENSSGYTNPWLIAIEGGLLFNLQDKKSNNFLFILPTVGFTDVAKPGIDIRDNFFWNLKFGIPINLKYK